MITVVTPLSYGQQQMLKAHELTPMHVILEYYTYIRKTSGCYIYPYFA